jgi:3',5'-cyclic AMP phosphodiesterase CpdA
VLIAHLSDPHIRSGTAGAETATGLHRALGRALALDRRPDCVVITGDLVENGRSDQYDVLVDVIGDYPIPIHLVTGNHDDPALLATRFGGSSFLGGQGDVTYAVDYGDAVVIALHSPEPHGPGGVLGNDQLAWLDATLARRPDIPGVVCLHHPPVPVGIPFLDAMGLRDAADLAAVLGRHRNVARVLAGHVHRAVTASFAGTTVSVAPSTYRQSTLTMRADGPMGYLHEPAGFLLHLLDTTTYVTHLVPSSHTSAVTGHF